MAANASPSKARSILRSIGIQLLPLGLTIGYGHLNSTVEAVLDANQGLADEVQPYQAGVVIHLPDVVGASEEGVMLWS